MPAGLDEAEVQTIANLLRTFLLSQADGFD